MSIGASTTPPIGHRLFCAENPMDCEADMTSSSTLVTLSPELMAQVASINTATNAAIQPKSDRELFGVEEKWTYPDGQGDCEDYALLKRRLLKQAGISETSLLMTVVRKRNGEGHAVLTLLTTEGDFVLDNLNWQVKVWRDTPYTYVKRQDPSDLQAWLTIADGTDFLVSSLKK